MKKAILFNIQRFCVHDGPGIRTTLFFKGCSMNCAWCHNPESKAFFKEISYDDQKCNACGQCILQCPQKRLLKEGSRIVVDPAILCIGCENCTDMCIQEARELAGREKSITQLMKSIEADRLFYEESQGGVTFSGGEALCQIKVLVPLAEQCHTKGIHVAIDTCGNVPYAHFEKILPYTNLVLYDIKHLNSETHRAFTGVGNQLILDNLMKLAETHVAIWLRLPLITGFNATDEYIDKLIDQIRDLRIEQVHLLPYHTIAVDKYRRFGMSYDHNRFNKPSKQWLNETTHKFENAGFKTLIGG